MNKFLEDVHVLFIKLNHKVKYVIVRLYYFMLTQKNKLNLHDLPVALVAVDLCIFKIIEGDLCIFLDTAENTLYENLKCLPGSLISAHEEAENTLSRVLKDKTNLHKADMYFEQLYTFSKVHRDKRSRVVSIAYMCLYKGDICDAFVKVRDVHTLAYDHKEILNVAVERLKSKMGYTTIISKLITAFFTYSELQKMYEVILNIQTDKRNFRKKIDSLHIITETGEKKQEGKMRPAMLYRFVDDEVKAISVFE